MRLVCGVLLLALAIVAPARSQPAAPPETLFRNVRVFDGSGSAVSGTTDVLVRGNVIAAIGAGAASPAATVIDGGGRTLMPGLIDAHVHLAFMGLGKEALMSSELTPAAIETATAREATAMLLRGFTAVRDMGGPVFALKRAIDRGAVVGPRIWPSGAMISQTSGHGDLRLPSEGSRRFTGKPSRSELLGANFIADGRDEVLTATRENLRFGASQIKLMAGGGASSDYDPLDVTQYTLDELKAAVEAADDWNTYVTVHAYTPRAVRRAVDAGVKCIEHGQLLDEATIQLLVDKGIWLSLQNLPPAGAADGADMRAKKAMVAQGSDAAWATAKRLGVKLAWGTDFLFDPARGPEQNAYLLKLRRWFTPAEILTKVTRTNAELLALSGPRAPYAGKLGAVAPGALADLILVDGDPVANIDLVADPAKNFLVIMKDGKVYKNMLRR